MLRCGGTDAALCGAQLAADPRHAATPVSVDQRLLAVLAAGRVAPMPRHQHVRPDQITRWLSGQQIALPQLGPCPNKIEHDCVVFVPRRQTQPFRRARRRLSAAQPGQTGQVVLPLRAAGSNSKTLSIIWHCAACLHAQMRSVHCMQATWASPLTLERRMFCNRSLNMRTVTAVGFDMVCILL